NAAIDEAFPQLSDNITVVVEAATPEASRRAAEALAEALRDDPARFRQIFYPEGASFFRRNGLLYLGMDELQALADRLARAQPLLSALAADPSLRGLADALEPALAAETDIPRDELRTALARIAEVIEALDETPDAPRILSWHALLAGEETGWRGGPEDRRQLMTVQAALDFGSLAPADAAIDAVRDAAERLGSSEAEDLSVRLTGSAVLFQEELRSVQRGLGLVALLSALLVGGLLTLGLRSARLVLATLVSLAIGLALTAGFAALAIGELNLISVAFAVLFIGLGVDFGIHFALRYREAVETQGPGGALVAAARGVGGALTLCTVAAAAGFLSFLPTDYRGVSELGLISAVGMVIALFVNLTVLPAILKLWPLNPTGRELRIPAVARLERTLMDRPRPVIAGALLLGLVSVALLPQARFDDDPLNLRDPESESVSTLLDLMADSRVEPYGAELLAPSLARAEAFAERLEALPEVASTTTLADFVPQAQEAKLAIIDELAFFLTPLFAVPSRAPPGSEETAAALIRLREALRAADGSLAPAASRLATALDGLAFADPAMQARLKQALLGSLPDLLGDLEAALMAGPVGREDLPPALRERYLAADGRARIEIAPAADLRDPAAREAFVASLQAVAPQVAGLPVTITEAGEAVVRAFAEAAMLALAAVLVLLLVVLRSLRDSALVLAPLMLAALLTVTATVLLGIPFNFANVIVLPLLFGLGVASGIHIVLRARRTGVAAVLTTSTPRAVLFSALTTIGSFGALALSDHRGTASMGVLLTIAIALTLVCTLVVLPALLARVPLAAEGPRKPGGRARLWPLLALLGLGLVIFFLVQVDPAEVGAAVLRLGWLGALAVIAIYGLAFLLDTLSWRTMLPSLRPGLGGLYALWNLRLVGEALNLVIPAGSLGGEPAKAYLLARRCGIDYREGIASLVMSKTVNLLSLVVFATIGLALMVSALDLPSLVTTLSALVLGALGIGAVGFFAVQRLRAASRVAAFFAGHRLGHGLRRYLEQIAAVDARFVGFYAGTPGRFAAAFALAFLHWAVAAGEVMAILWFLGAPVGLAEAWAIQTVAELVRAGAFFIPAGLGASEGAMLLLFDALLGRPALGLALALIRRGRELLWIAVGLWLGGRYALTPRAIAAAALRSGANERTGPGAEIGPNGT
ncbi:MAG TPA: lysylphosphatidylglycerol synthase domain-containing protein, partial [Kiloniellales bacterium]|nr:lysylphosphatidylglycerol synthase domain-containing protein [Kiloniellales bacterium]